ERPVGIPYQTADDRPDRRPDVELILRHAPCIKIVVEGVRIARTEGHARYLAEHIITRSGYGVLPAAGAHSTHPPLPLRRIGDSGDKVGRAGGVLKIQDI